MLKNFFFEILRDYEENLEGVQTLAAKINTRKLGLLLLIATFRL